MKKNINILCVFIAFFFSCKTDNKKIRITGEFPSDNNAVVALTNENKTINKIVNVKNHKFSFVLDYADSGFYAIKIRMPNVLGDERWFKNRFGKQIKFVSARTIYKKIYVNPKIDSVYHLRLSKTVKPAEIELMWAKEFNTLNFDLLTKCYDSKVYEELEKIKNKYSKIKKVKEDSLAKMSDYYLQLKQMKQYTQTSDSATTLWKDNLFPKMKLEYKVFMKKHLNSVITPYLIDQSPDLIQNSVFYLNILNSLYGTAKGSTYEKSARRRLESINKLVSGYPLPNPKGETPDGKTYKFNPSKSKYTLIEFWASWCAPCRAKNPELIKLYHKYSRKDFDIISVSIDTDREKWLTAIKEDKLLWPNVSDLLPIEQSENTARFNVFSIPYNFLIDRNGKIVKKEVAIKDLERILN